MIRTQSVSGAIAIFLLLSSPIFAGTYPDSAKTEYLVQIQHLLYNDKFHEADSLSGLLIEKYPHDPAGYLFQAMTLLSEMFDREENLHGEKFNWLIDAALSRASSIIDTASSSTCAWMCLFRGHARAYRALWESRFGSIVRAIKLGRQATGEYERGLACDSSLYDLYFGLGLYHYFKSAKAGVLRLMGLFKDDRARGISELYLAADSSILSQEAARSALIWIRLDRKEYDSVITDCHEMLKKYPDGKAFLWPLARACFEKKDYRNALATFQLLRERMAENPGNYLNLTECDYYLFLCCEKLAMKAEAKQIALRTARYYKQTPQETRRRQRAKFALLRRAART